MRFRYWLLIFAIQNPVFAQNSSDKIDYYIRESQAARLRNDHNFSCELANFASDLASDTMKGSQKEELASRIKIENCKVTEDQRKREAERSRREIEKWSQEQEEFCRKWRPLIRKAFSDCSHRNDIEGCVRAKFDYPNDSIFSRITYCK